MNSPSRLQCGIALAYFVSGLVHGDKFNRKGQVSVFSAEKYAGKREITLT